MSRYLLLLNRGAGGSERGLDPASTCGLIERRFRSAAHDIESLIVRPGDLDATLRRILENPPDAVLIAGGDGTVSAAASHLGGSGIAMGVLPMGTFNLAARDLGIPLDLEEAAEFLTRAEPRAIDVLDVGGHSCLCVTLLGFYPAYARMFERRDHGGRWWRKAIKILGALPGCFERSRPLHLHWEGPGVPAAGVRTKFCAFLPGRYQPAVGLVPERTDLDSGKLTAYIGTQRNPGEAVRAIFSFVAGRQEQNPDLIHFTTTALTLNRRGSKHATVMIDGELLRLAFPLTLRILPRRLRVLSAPESAGTEDRE